MVPKGLNDGTVPGAFGHVVIIELIVHPSYDVLASAPIIGNHELIR